MALEQYKKDGVTNFFVSNGYASAIKRIPSYKNKLKATNVPDGYYLLDEFREGYEVLKDGQWIDVHPDNEDTEEGNVRVSLQLIDPDNSRPLAVNQDYKEYAEHLELLLAPYISTCKSQQKLIQDLSDRVINLKWISVHDRLPEHGKDCLVYLRESEFEFGDYEVNSVEKGYYPETSDNPEGWIYYSPIKTKEFWGKVTHWLPIPSPPKDITEDMI